MREMQGTRGMFTSIPGNVFMFVFWGNVREDSGECSGKFWRMFRKISGNVFNFMLMKAMFYLKKANAN